MLRIVSRLSALFLLLGATSLFAVDGVVLINQSTVLAAGGFPYKITQSGSYKLTGNLVVPADTDGIDVMANDVTLDLNGFSIVGAIVCQGTTNCTPAPAGVFATGISALANGVTIQNGHVRGFSRGVKTF